MKKLLRSPWVWIVVAAVGVLIALQYLVPNGGYKEVDTSTMVKDINNGSVKEVTFKDGGNQQILATLDNGDKVTATWVTGQQRGLVRAAQAQYDKGEIKKYNVQNPKPSLLGSILATLLPFVLIVGLFLFLMNQVQGGGGRVMQFGKSKAKLISKDMPKTTFADVAGCEEAIEELGEIKEFLQEPAKFQAVGAKIPKGVLLYGQPGTGKTLLARAVAGEAGVPFYSISGSDFVEMFVGVGASRVRDLFEQAKENAPAIVFIDEIDAVGRHRGAGMGGGHDEREQTLNQLLVEMDGFDVRGGVILIAATNRPDILDPALLRPGRFDRQISVDAPDLHGREQILTVHARGKPMAPDVDLVSVARRTPGFTGADLANVLNEAALLTARENKKLVDNYALDEAIDRVIAGPQKRTRLMSEKEKLLTAYHEGGHALVAAAMPGSDPVHKVTILPRGRALGYTMVLPDEDKYSQTRSEMLDKLAYMMGGMAAEELIFHDVDLRRGQRHREGDPPRAGDGDPVRDEPEGRRDQAGREQRRAVPRPRHGPSAQLLRRGRRRDRRGDQEPDRLRAAGGPRRPRPEPRGAGLPRARPDGEGDPRQGAGGRGLQAVAATSGATGLDGFARPLALGRPARPDPGEGPRRRGQRRASARGRGRCRDHASRRRRRPARWRRRRSRSPAPPTP